MKGSSRGFRPSQITGQLVSTTIEREAPAHKHKHSRSLPGYSAPSFLLLQRHKMLRQRFFARAPLQKIIKDGVCPCVQFTNTPGRLRHWTPVRPYSEPVAPKSFKASTFSLPKESKLPQTAAKPSINPEMQDFEMTRLVRGETDLKIAITEQAKKKLISIAEGDKNPDLALRVKVESGGCHGFQYNFELTDLAKELEKEADLVVFKRTDTDLATVIFDDSSLEILQDLKLDYTNELIGSSFKMVDSPYTSTSCGCGASFDFDFEKLERAKNSS